MRNIYLRLGALLVLVLSSTSFSQEQQENKPFSIDRSTVVDIHSVVNGKEYEIYIKLPDSYTQNTTKKYPLILLTDGYYAFPLVSSINWRMTERHEEYKQSIIVGISYSKGDDINNSRTRDFTPSFAPNEAFNSKAAQAQSGQAALYVKFLAQEVLPYVLKNYRVDATKKVYAGHSFGGLLGLYILFTQPALFDTYLIGSPSLWYDNKIIFKLEAEYAKQHKDLPAKVFIATGADEAGPPQFMVEDMFALKKVLDGRRYPNLVIRAKTLAGEGHLSGYPVFITQGLLWALPFKKTKAQ